MRYLVIGFLLHCCLINIGYAQFNTIKVDGVGMVGNRVSIGYERTFGKVVSFQVGFEKGTYAKGTVNGEIDYSLKGKNLTFEFRGYPLHKSKQAPNGFFIGEGFRYTEYNERYEDIFGGRSRPLSLNNSIFKNIYVITGYKYNYRKFSIEGSIAYGLMDQVNFNKYRYQIPEGYRNFLKESGNGFIDERGLLRLKIFLGYTFPKIGKEKRRKEQNSNS